MNSEQLQMSSNPSSLIVSKLTKRFGRFTALDSVSLEFLPGEVHAVLGENGAGKSTLMNLIACFLAPDGGEILWHGKPLPYNSPYEAKKMGIGMIHQHFTLVPKFSPRENLALAKLKHLGKGLSIRKESQAAMDTAQRLGWTIPDSKVVSGLPVGTQQRIEILKSISGNEEILIFDEPTAPLSKEETEGLLNTIRQLAKEGRIVILIAHKLGEVMACADRVSVLKRGKFIGSMPINEAKPEKLAEMMVGEPPKLQVRQPSAMVSDGLRVNSISVKADRGEIAVKELSFNAKRGEILGIGGVDGNGQIELSEAIAGVRKLLNGSIEFAGTNSPIVAFIPGDRRREGLALHMSIVDNLFMGGLTNPELSWGPLLKPKKIESWARNLIRDYDVRTPSERILADSLSGGNQQKVVVSREFSKHPDLIVAVHPTRGLDIKATAFVYKRLLEARQNGAAVVLISADLDELAALSDHIFFLSHGEKFEANSAAAVVGGLT